MRADAATLAVEFVRLVAHANFLIIQCVVVPRLDAYQAAEPAVLVFDVREQLERRRVLVALGIVQVAIARGLLAGEAILRADRRAGNQGRTGVQTKKGP